MIHVLAEAERNINIAAENNSPDISGQRDPYQKRDAAAGA